MTCFSETTARYTLPLLSVPVMWKRMWNLEREWGRDLMWGAKCICSVDTEDSMYTSHWNSNRPTPCQRSGKHRCSPRAIRECLQWSLSRVLMWVEGKGIHSKWKPRDEKKPEIGWWKEARKSAIDNFFSFLNGLTWAKHGVGYETKMWCGILVTRGLTQDKKLAGVFFSLVSHISLCSGEWV